MRAIFLCDFACLLSKLGRQINQRHQHRDAPHQLPNRPEFHDVHEGSSLGNVIDLRCRLVFPMTYLLLILIVCGSIYWIG